MINRRKHDPLRFQRCITAKSLARNYAASLGAPSDLVHEAAMLASGYVLMGETVWRAYRHSMAWLDRQADANGWFMASTDINPRTPA